MSVKRSILQTNPKTACDIQREDKDYWHGHRADCNDYLFICPLIFYI